MKRAVALVAILAIAGVFGLMAFGQGYDTMPADALILDFEDGSWDDVQPAMEYGVQGGTVYISSISNPRKWNEVTANETSTTQYTYQMNRGLVHRHEATGAYIGDLAKSWEISEDGLTLTYHLREGIKWSDGEDFTSEDVVFTFNDLIFNDDIETDSRDGLYLPDGNLPVLSAPDANTVVVEMSVIFRPALSALSINIMPKHKLADSVHKLNPDVPAGTFNEAWGLDTPVEDLAGMGPYMPESWAPDLNVTFKRNPYYYVYDANGTQLPYADKYVVVTVASQDVSLLKFRNGELDALGIRPSDVPLLKREEATKGLTVGIGGGAFGTLWVSFNEDYGLDEGDAVKDQLRNLFRDVRFRIACSHAVDKVSIINNLYNGLALPQWSFCSTPSPFYGGRDVYGGPVTEADAVVYEYDLALANSMLDEIGIMDTDGDGIREFADGTPVSFELITNAGNTLREGFCLILQEDWGKLGLDVIFQPIDFNTAVTRLLAGPLYQAAVLGLTGGFDPHGGSNVQKSTGGLHFWHYSGATDPYDYEVRMDELFDLGAGTFDNDEAFGYYKEAQLLDATQMLGTIYSVNQSSTFAYYNYLKNAQVQAQQICSPQSQNGLGWDLVWLDK